MKLKLSALAVTLLLFGCSTNQKFDCPYKDGVRCQRISTIDKEIDSGKLQVWLAPYESGEGIYHQASMLNIKLRSKAP